MWIRSETGRPNNQLVNSLLTKTFMERKKTRKPTTYRSPWSPQQRRRLNYETAETFYRRFIIGSVDDATRHFLHHVRETDSV